MFGLWSALRRVVAALNGFAERIESVNSEWDARADNPAMLDESEPKEIVDSTAKKGRGRKSA